MDSEEIQRSQREFEEAVLGGPRRHTRLEVAELTGVPLERCVRLWRAMGFADVDDEQRAFTDTDVAALRLVEEFFGMGVLSENMQLAATRTVAQTAARLAEWQVDAYYRFLAENGGDLTVSDAVAVARDIIPRSEQLLVYVWRRHLADVGHRALTQASEDAADKTLGIGFADLAGFTSLTRRLSQEDLAELIDRFESRAWDIIASHGGRVVKTVGDEILFVTDDPAELAEVGLQLAELSDLDGLPQVHAGLACGPVLSRLGDVYGAPVNIAARLSSTARPGTVLVDRELAQLLKDKDRYAVKPVPRVTVRGYSNLEPWVLRRARPDSDN